jgi:dethiobiotin synthetase
MSRGIYIIGTDTDVGKTVVAAALMHLFMKNGYRTAYFKPVASGTTIMGGSEVSADAAFVRLVSGFDEQPELTTPFAFADPVAPHLAARWSGRRINPAVIQERLQHLKNRYEVIIAEGAGGLAVPLNDEGVMQDAVIRTAGLPCLLVARSGLGTINHTLLTLAYAEKVGIRISGILFNRFGNSPLEQDNISTIQKLSGMKAILTFPDLRTDEGEQGQAEQIRQFGIRFINFENLKRLMGMV